MTINQTVGENSILIFGRIEEGVYPTRISACIFLCARTCAYAQTFVIQNYSV